MYGTHVITGITKGCSLDISYKQSIKSTDNKLSVVANLRVGKFKYFWADQ